MRIAIVLGVVIAALAPRPADACTTPYRSAFELFDEAAVVVHAKVVSFANNQAVLSIVTPLKGVAGGTKTITIPAVTSGAVSSCSPIIKGTGVAYVGANGRTIGAYMGFAPASAELVAALTAYGASSNLEDRAAALVDQIVPGQKEIRRTLARDAANLLAETPLLLDAITAPVRARLIAAAPNAEPTDYLAWLLLRLGVPDLDKLYPGIRPGTLAIGSELAKLATVTSTSVLAAAIESKPPGSARAHAALERCERVRKRPLGFVYVMVSKRGAWRDLAYLCRTGQPPPEQTMPPAAVDPATKPEERARILVDIITASDRDNDFATKQSLVYEAVFHLSLHPELLVEVTPAQRDRLVAAVPRIRPETVDLPMVLARIGVPNLAQVLPVGFRERDLAIALAAARTFEHVTSAAELAKVIAAEGISESPRATAAFERCERLHRKSLGGLAYTRFKQDWAPYAKACRTGVAR